MARMAQLTEQVMIRMSAEMRRDAESFCERIGIGFADYVRILIRIHLETVDRFEVYRRLSAEEILEDLLKRVH